MSRKRRAVERGSYASERTVEVTPMSRKRRAVERDAPTPQREQWRSAPMPTERRTTERSNKIEDES